MAVILLPFLLIFYDIYDVKVDKEYFELQRTRKAEIKCHIKY